VWQESRWQAGAVSPKGARGLAQLMPQTARALGADADDPVQNVAAGARYLHGLLEGFHGNLEAALAAYNAGPARVARAGGVPPIAETRRYVAAILARLAAQSKDRR
jgi:soluble lytic murein transglycosylase-like protein